MESTFDSISDNKIPIQWLELSYPSEKCFASYLKDFCNRLKWLQNWWLTEEIPKTFWLSAFFHPRKFLGVVKLNFARKYEIPLEEITLDSKVRDNEEWGMIYFDFEINFYNVFSFG